MKLLLFESIFLKKDYALGFNLVLDFNLRK